MTVTYEDIQKANETIRTMPIKRWDKKNNREIVKDYAEVNQRIKAFRMVYPTGKIITQMVSNDNGVCIFRAEVYKEDPDELPIATGTAYEKENSSLINSTSYIENCETSAVGRALGMAGFGIDTSIASYEEVTTAMANQNPTESPNPGDSGRVSDNGVELITEKQKRYLSKYYKGETLEKLLNTNGIKELGELPKDKASELVSKIMEKERNNK